MRNIIFLLLSVCIVTMTGCSSKDEFIITTSEDCDIQTEESVDNNTSLDNSDTANMDIYVYICGQVMHEGVYILSKGDRVYQAIEAAGGLTGEADSKQINQAMELTDGIQIYIPAIGESINNQLVNEDVDDGKININTASKEKLMEIPGIGETKAIAIINYRETKGNFNTIEDIMNIDGIKEGTFNKIKDYIKVS